MANEQVLIADALKSLGYLLVDIEREGRGLLRVTIENIDYERPIDITDCEKVSRHLNYSLPVDNVNYERLEVSSPGVDEPLILNRQYVKNIGRTVEVILNDEAVFTGVLKEVTDKDILIEWTAGKGKKATQESMLIPFENIKSTIVQIQF